ncbi:MAG: hypothetical protein Q8734_01465 [Sweet potato little leaf phytoplasma]|nr:hypothetical protein [Sweet potato little leaf phytoplasma]
MLGNIAGNVADKGLLNKLGDYIDKKINQYYDGQSQSAKPLEYATTSDNSKSLGQGQLKVGHAETDNSKSLGQGQLKVGHAETDNSKSLGQSQFNRNRVVFNSQKSPRRSKNKKTRYISNQNQNLDSVEYKEKTEKKL